MSVQQQKPTSPGRRHVKRIVSTLGLSKKNKRLKALTISKKRLSGRSTSTGRITVHRRGGGHKRHTRVIDFRRDKIDIPGKIERIEYDPNRSAHIALVLYADGERRYIIAPRGVKAGDQVISGPRSPIKPGNSMPLQNVPVGSVIHCIEMKPGKGAQLIRTAGASAQLSGREGGYAIIKMRSGELRRILASCIATIGEVSNSEHNLRSLGKAGASRWRGRRPTVRGVAMNPIDHPHGGGEGKTSAGRHPVTPWGQPTKGYKTRRRKISNSMIIRDRRKK